MDNPVVEEVHAIREALSKASDHDIQKIAEAAKVRQTERGRGAYVFLHKRLKWPGRHPERFGAVSPVAQVSAVADR